MNNSELDDILRKARVSEPPGELWDLFPRRIISRLNQPAAPVVRAGPGWSPRLAWGLAAAICVLAAFAIGHWRGRMETKAAENDVLQSAKLIRETLATFPHQVRAIVGDKNGLHLILSDHNDVPDSTPIYIRVCDGKQCASFVTFSGQEIAMAGREVTVLSDARGGVILTGNRFLWSSDERVAVDNGWKIEARNLGRL
ncbi:MAG TPA: hypothetical protein VMA35_07865 [Candidatus Sulfopaludibacter sp.]|nr:hypothetical protein [Candidatus Sulfopaludibacter sp.]